MGQFRMMAVVALLWAGAASAASLGTLNVSLNNVESRTEYERDARLGSYVLQSQTIKFNLNMQGRQKLEPVVYNVVEGDDVLVSLQRRGSDAYLQFYTVVSDPLVRMKVPLIETRKIKLSDGNKWADFDAGLTVTVTVESAQEVEEARQTLESFASLYFEQIIREILSRRGVTTNNPRMEVISVPARTIKLSQKHMTMLIEGGAITVKAEAFTPDQQPVQKKAGGVTQI